MYTPTTYRSLFAFLALFSWMGAIAFAAPPNTNTAVVHGRVFNAGTASYTRNARIVIDETTLEALTNDFGEYRIANVPAGEITLRLIYPGFPDEVVTLNLEPGASVRKDFELRAAGAETSTQQPDDDSVFVLSPFIVSASTEIAASNVAIIAQRYAPNVKNVVDIGEFGDLGESNLGEFIKFLPGVAIDYNGNEPRSVAVRGFPATYTALMIDGNRAASASSSKVSRNTELMGFALHNLARIEVTKTPTPETPADAIGGSVDLISRSAFERRKPFFSFRTYGTFNSDNITIDRLHGPTDNTSGLAIRPGFDFVYQNPINQKIGISVNGQYFQRLNPTHIARTEWSPTSARIGNGTETDPYLSRFQLLEGPQDSETTSMGVVLDYRIAPGDIISVATNYVKRETYTDLQQMEFMVGNNPESWDETHTHGSAVGRAGFANSDYRHKTSDTSHSSLSYRHIGPLWSFDAGLFYSQSTNDYRDISDGFFRGIIIRRRNVSVNYDDISQTGPDSISVTTSEGQTLNPFILDDLVPEQGSSEESDAKDVFRGGHFDISREVASNTDYPVTLKAGGDLREQHRDIDLRSRRWNFRGSDHSGSRPTTGPDSELVKDLEERYGVSLTSDYYGENEPSFGYPVVEWPSPEKFYEFFQVTSAMDDAMWREDTAFANRDSASRSPEITETVGAGYLQADSKLFDNNLWIVTGVRFESTRVDAYGVKYVEGSNSSGISNYSYIARGDRRVTTYDDFFPSLNVSYRLGRNLIARGAISRSIGRPDFLELAPGVTVDDAAAPIYRITINNPDLKPAYSTNYDLSLEYYFEDAGVLSVSTFLKEIDDFVGQSIHTATEEDLASIGIAPTDPDYASYIGDDILMKVNVDSVRIKGVEVNYKQPLTFLPDWAYGVQAFVNGTLMDLDGDNLSDFTGYQSKTLNWGVKLNRDRFSISLNWSYSGKQRGLLVTGVGVPPNTFEYVDSRLVFDANFGIRLTKHLEFYGSGRNLTNEPIERLRYSPGTPAYARSLRYEEYGIQFSLGLRGTY